MSDYSDEQLQMVEDCMARESKLTAWEVDFLESIETLLEQGWKLTDRQDDVLNSIRERVTSRG